MIQVVYLLRNLFRPILRREGCVWVVVVKKIVVVYLYLLRVRVYLMECILVKDYGLDRILMVAARGLCR